jgi:hypothetical protein
MREMDLIQCSESAGSSSPVLAPDSIRCGAAHVVVDSVQTETRFVGHPRLKGVPFIGVSLDHLSKDEIVASFQGIHMSGRDESEAVNDLFTMLLDMLDTFSAHEASLGPVPRQQLTVLRQYFDG